jgi:2-oxoglutarate ferredoxin oxidoreductase subunit alpha
MRRDSVAIALAGSGGAGVMTIGAMLLDAAARAGYYGLFARLSGPQVRGGEAAALLRLGTTPVEAPPDCYDLLLAIDWSHVERFAAEIPLAASSAIVGDPRMGEVPAAIAASGAHRIALAMAAEAAQVPGGRPNMIAMGVVAGLLGLSRDAVTAVATERIRSKGEAAIEASRAALQRGFDLAPGLELDLALAEPSPAGRRWSLSGNEAAAMGALRGGVRFVAGYPITPSTEIVEWLAPLLPRVGGNFVQAEDELAAINMVIGGSYGGVPSLTVTSGPGLSLMVEALGLATAAEIPLVVIDVQRGGPSTGIPTKSEQGDLNLAVFGAHGDAPRIVTAPLSIADSLPTTQWSVELAERLQVPAIVLSDQMLGQARAVIDAPETRDSEPSRLLARGDAAAGYERYALTESGISPFALPGLPGGQWIGEGLTHNEAGTPSSAAKDHVAQLDKRLRKLASHDFGDRWAEIQGDGDLAVVTWGSTSGVVSEALRRLRAEGEGFRHVALRLLAPLQAARLRAALAGAARVLVIELNQSAQLCGYLRSAGGLELPLDSHARPGPLPFRPDEIVRTLRAWRARGAGQTASRDASALVH